MLETWLKLDMLMVQSPQHQSQWLLVVTHMVDQRECIFQRDNSIIIIFSVRIRNCGNSTLSKAKSSFQHYHKITQLVSACFLLMQNTAARIRSRKFSKSQHRETSSLNFLIQIKIDSQKIHLLLSYHSGNSQGYAGCPHIFQSDFMSATRKFHITNQNSTKAYEYSSSYTSCFAWRH